MQNQNEYSSVGNSQHSANTKDSGMQDPEWNGLHCTCGAGAFDDVEHEAGCTVTIIRKLERQRDELAGALGFFLDGAQSTKNYAGAYYISDAAIEDLKAALAKCNDSATLRVGM